MTLAEAIYQHSLRLPEPTACEAPDFIQFLEQRYGIVESPANVEPAGETSRAQALARLAQVRIHWNGKPIPDRDALYAEACAGR